MIAGQALHACAYFIRVHANGDLRGVELGRHPRICGLVVAVSEREANPVGNACAGEGGPDCVVGPPGEGAGVGVEDYIEETGGAGAAALLWGGRGDCRVIRATGVRAGGGGAGSSSKCRGRACCIGTGITRACGVRSSGIGTRSVRVSCIGASSICTGAATGAGTSSRALNCITRASART